MRNEIKIRFEEPEYEVNRVELKTLWVGKEKKTVILLHGKHIPLC